MSNAIALRKPQSISYEICHLTPADADEFLKLNKHNRPIIEGDVMRWAAEMAAGRWSFNGEAIKISADDVLLDGQNRMLALSLQKPGTEIEFLIIRGLPAESQATMDQGRKRSASDQLNLAGITSNKSLASAIRVYLTWDQDLLFIDNKKSAAVITTPRIVQWAAENDGLVELMRDAGVYGRIKARTGIICAIYAKLCVDHSVEAAGEFFDRMLDGIGLQSGSPILALRNRLDRIHTEGFRLSERDTIGFFVTAFNHWTAGNKIVKLQRPRDGGWTKLNFPKVAAA